MRPAGASCGSNWKIGNSSTVTVRGGAQLDLNGFSDTIGSLVFNSQGGSNGNQGPLVQTGAGTLTIAPGGSISATNLIKFSAAEGTTK